MLSLLLTLRGTPLVHAGHRRRPTYEARSSANSTRSVVTPAVRGLILDDKGRPLAQNRDVDRGHRQPDVLAAQSDRRQGRAQAARQGPRDAVLEPLRRARGGAGRTPTPKSPSAGSGSPLPADPGRRGRLDRGRAVHPRAPGALPGGEGRAADGAGRTRSRWAPTPLTSSATSARRPRRRSPRRRTPTRRSRPPTWSARPASRRSTTRTCAASPA